MAERLAVAMRVPNADSYFLVGLFSLVDALLNVPMPEAIQLLPFSKQIREGLLNHEGPMGSVLRCVLAYENGNWTDARCGSLEAATIRQCYLEGISAARSMPK
jgi:EAL and modified HD-GYP domain-containing signal transduction protein